MDSRKWSSSTRHQSDLISGLTNDVLGHVLSFLPTKEAARAAALARRWRHVFGSVHTISFQEEEGEREQDWITFYYRSEERKSCSNVLLDAMNSALLCRRRCPGLAVPVRSLHFAFDSWHWWDKVAVDQWLAYVLPPPRHRGGNSSHPGLHLHLCFRICLFCHTDVGDNREEDSGSDQDENKLRWRYLLPRRLFSCTASRTLCLSYCRLKLPGVPIDLPFLETLRLTDLSDSERSIQRLISSCPRLVDLALEALFKLKRVSVVDKRLRCFALLCCHHMRSVHIDVSELRSLDYKGMLPKESLLSLHGSPVIIPWCTIELCRFPHHSEEFAGLTSFLEKICNTKHLHLHYNRLERGFFAAGLPMFSSLTWLTLQGCIRTRYTVTAVGRILEQTPSLEVLCLIMKEPQENSAVSDETRVPNDITVPQKLNFCIPCLGQRLRVFRMEGYDGCEQQPSLAKLLLRNALVLERLHVVFAEGLRSKQKRELEVRMGRWGAANSKKIFI